MADQPAQPIMARSTARLIVGVTLLVLALLMVLSFFFMSWIEIEKDTKKSSQKMTPVEIWQGKNNGHDFTLKIGKDIPNGGFDDVRFVDRLLIIMPLIGMAIGALTIFYLLLAASPRTVLITIAVLAFLFMIFPYIWEAWSNANFKSGLKDMGLKGNMLDNGLSTLRNTYSVGEFAMLGLLAFLVSLIGIAAEANLPATLERQPHTR